MESFVLDKSNGFTQAGVARINDSIRTYVWSIVGAQSQARSSILGTGKAFDAQKQFLANVEDVINSEVDLPGSIERYQLTLQYARSKVDFVVGLGLYMIPSDMDLYIGTINGYNNLITIASLMIYNLVIMILLMRSNKFNKISLIHLRMILNLFRMIHHFNL